MTVERKKVECGRRPTKEKIGDTVRKTERREEEKEETTATTEKGPTSV